MPRLSADSSIILAADIFGQLENRIADPESLIKSQDAAALDLASIAWQRSMGQIWRRGEQKVLGAAMVKIGFPVGKAADAVMEVLEFLPVQLDRMVDEAFRKIKSEIREGVAVLTDRIVRALLERGFEALSKVMTAIPQMQWVAKLVVGIARAVVRVIRHIRQQRKREQFVYERAEFSPDLDSLIANEICLETLRGSLVWDNLFISPTARWGRVKLKGGGYRYHAGFPFYAGEEPPGLRERSGFVPGTNAIFRQWEIAGSEMLSTGDYLPTAREVCVSAWSLANEPTPAMFTTSVGNVRGHWSLILSRLWEYIQTLKQNEAKAVREMAKRQFGGDWEGSIQKAVRTARPIIAIEALGARQRELMNAAHDAKGPILPAYLSPEYGAFAGDSFRLENAQRSILERRILPQIDFSVVPDGDFKRAILDRLRRATSIATGPIQGRPAAPGIDQLAEGVGPYLSEAPSPGGGIRLSEAPDIGEGEITIIPEDAIRDPALTRPPQNPDPAASGISPGLIAAAIAGGIAAAWKVLR